LNTEIEDETVMQIRSSNSNNKHMCVCSVAADRHWLILPRWNMNWMFLVAGRPDLVALWLQSRHWEVYSETLTSNKCHMRPCSSCTPPFSTTLSSSNMYVALRYYCL